MEWLDDRHGEAMALEVEEAIRGTLRLALMDQLGGSLSRLETNLSQITDVLKNVLDLVLNKRGMKLEKLVISPGETTRVSVAVALTGDTIEGFAVEFRFRSDTPLLAYITGDDQAELTEVLTRRLAGTPFSDTGWIEKIVIREVKEYFAGKKQYAEFEQLILVLPGATTRVYATLMPREGTLVVARYFVKLRSGTMLNLQLDDVGGFVAANMETLRGLPTAFIEAKSAAICEYLERETVFAPQLGIFDPVVAAELYTVRDDLSLVFSVESQRFRLSASGRVDLNREENVARFDFTTGLRLNSLADLWVHGTFYPGDFELRPQIGLGIRPSAKTMFEAGYDFKMNSAVLRAQINALPDLYFSADHYMKSRLKDENEYGAAYIFRNYYEFKVITDFRDELFASVGVRI